MIAVFLFPADCIFLSLSHITVDLSQEKEGKRLCGHMVGTYIVRLRPQEGLLVVTACGAKRVRANEGILINFFIPT